jgi:hypothetical protein
MNQEDCGTDRFHATVNALGAGPNGSGEVSDMIILPTPNALANLRWICSIVSL